MPVPPQKPSCHSGISMIRPPTRFLIPSRPARSKSWPCYVSPSSLLSAPQSLLATAWRSTTYRGYDAIDPILPSRTRGMYTIFIPPISSREKAYGFTYTPHGACGIPVAVRRSGDVNGHPHPSAMLQGPDSSSQTRALADRARTPPSLPRFRIPQSPAAPEERLNDAHSEHEAAQPELPLPMDAKARATGPCHISPPRSSPQ
ncbi:hypothetical protein C8R45DRAFT_1215413 [Mycena sanguinolenta]|nr:hypothetical protein C8R45DRAFT_1215413 [Mycena sanguinolenta]